MRAALENYCILPSATVSEALSKINLNTKGFLIVIDEQDKVLGVLTDGDLRRAFLCGCTMGTPVLDVYNADAKYLMEINTLFDAIELLKSNTIKFLPVLDEQKKLKNILTKRQLHALLLHDIRADLSFDFMNLDESVVDYEIFTRPWGFYKTTLLNEYFQSKIISLKPGGKLSLQSHNHREEHWIIAHGTGVAQIGESIMQVASGSSLFIPKGCRHRLTNTSETESLIVAEVQIGDYFGEDDILRYEDAYGRI